MTPRETAAAPRVLTFSVPAEYHETHVHYEAPPALVSRVNCAHMGMTPRTLLETLRGMRADPRPHIRDAVVVRGKFRAAPPDKILEYLKSAPPVTEADPKYDPALLAKFGLEEVRR